MKPQKFSITARLQSFKYAFDGFKEFIKTEHNARLHLFFTLLVILSGFYFGLNKTEWIIIVFAIAIVFITEILNTSIEKIADFICTTENSKIKKIKDLAALAVLISALMAIVIGLIIFLPKILQQFNF
ncbi:diacylglycerol kinase family protein [Pedobacter alpinus]|uniref:Diacylglycerol kinase family protein n=1 Tax=Pedobacter alpinus TaxID=1590643 RepID=A0ABW5TVT6_9SPHI